MKKLSLLFALTLFSSVFSFARTYDGNEKIYIRPLAVSWWLNGNAKVGMYFFDDTPDPDVFQWVEATLLTLNGLDKIYFATVPAGTWTKVIITRNSALPLSWDNDWNKTGSIEIHATANYIQSFSENSTTATWQTLKAHYRSKTTGNWSDLSTWRASFDANWTNTSNYFDAHVIPNNNDLSVTIMGAHKVTADNTNTVSSLTINSTGELTINPGKQLTITGTATNNGTIKLLSNGTDGTATLVGNVGGNAEVQQHLTYRTWYMSSPVASATPAGMNRIKYFDETQAGNIWTLATTMTAGKGYLVVPTDDEDHISNILFTGTLNTGNLNIPLTRSAANTEKPGFNLIGNPYPSYLDWTKVCNYSTDAGFTKPNTAIMPTTTMWYRTKVEIVTVPGTYEYKFWTVNGDGVGTPATASKNIPPMQAFWVRAAASGNLALTNDMRLHESATTNQLKAPAAKNSELQLIRLQVNNGINTDETVLYVSDNAANGFDTYDAPKMSNDNIAIPEIYTTLDNQHIVINALKSLPLDTEIGLGFAAGDATSFSIRANEITNLPSDVKVILKDYANNGLETDLTDGVTAYNFAPATTTGNRFSIIFRSAGSTTALNTNTGNGISVYSLKKGINVTVNAELNEHATVRVFNAVGQQLVSQHLTNRSTTINGNFNPGVYVVKVSNGTTVTATQKIVIK